MIAFARHWAWAGAFLAIAAVGFLGCDSNVDQYAMDGCKRMCAPRAPERCTKTECVCAK